MFTWATVSPPPPPPTVIFTPNIGDLILAIIGTVAGLIGIIISIIIWRKVTSIENKRRGDQKLHFKTLIVNNVEEISKLYKSITVLSHASIIAFLSLRDVVDVIYN